MQDVLVIRDSGEMQVAHWSPECPQYAEWKVFGHEIDENGYEDRLFSQDLWDVLAWSFLPEQPERLNPEARFNYLIKKESGSDSLNSVETQRGRFEEVSPPILKIVLTESI